MTAITWERLTPDRFPLLRSWLAQPHVARWWNHETSPEAVERDFGPTARGEEPAEDLLVAVDGVPVGLVQRYRLHDYPDDLGPLVAQVPVPEGTASVDYLLGDPARIGHGLGPAVVRAVVDDIWRRWPGTPAVVVPVAAGNRRSWRALEKAGFRRVASVDLKPDNPVDGPLHHVYRCDRPDA